MNTDKMEYRLGVYEKSMPDTLSMEEKLRAAKQAGFDFVEMSVDESDKKMSRLDWTDDEMIAALKSERDAGLKMESICFSAQRKFPLGTEDKNKEVAAKELLKKAILFAVKMGIRIIQLQGYDCYYNEISNHRTKERFFRNLREAVSFASMYGVSLGIETMENDFINTVSKAMYYVTKIDSPYLQVYPDIGNITNATDYVCRDIRSGAGHVFSAHLKETVPGKFREIPYGEGNVDFPSAISALYETGVRRYVAEFWYTGQKDWQKIMAGNREFLKNQFLKASEFMQ